MVSAITPSIDSPWCTDLSHTLPPEIQWCADLFPFHSMYFYCPPPLPPLLTQLYNIESSFSKNSCPHYWGRDLGVRKPIFNKEGSLDSSSILSSIQSRRLIFSEFIVTFSQPRQTYTKSKVCWTNVECVFEQVFTRSHHIKNTFISVSLGVKAYLV